MLSLALVAAACISSSLAATKPNILFVFTDDQDILLGGFDHMPKTKALVQENGVTFSSGFANSPVCCVSRASLITGKFLHNELTVNNSVDGNCSSHIWQQTMEAHSFPTFVQAAGYKTFYAGKYLNQYGFPSTGELRPIPGFTQQAALIGNSRYYNYGLVVGSNATGYHEEKHGGDYEKDYLPLILKEKGSAFIKSMGQSDAPFFMMIGTPSAHAPFTPAPQYLGHFNTSQAPRVASFDAAGTDKHAFFRTLPPMDDQASHASDWVHNRRLETLLSIDDMVEQYVNDLDAIGQLENTYIFYSTDHGFHLGNFRESFDKRSPYETDIRVPYAVRGPGVAKNVTLTQAITHVDTAATIVDIATGSVPDILDGASYLHLLQSGSNKAPYRRDFLYQYRGEGAHGQIEMCGSGDKEAPPCPCDSWNNSYNCIRVLAGENPIGPPHPSSVSPNSVFCEFLCYDEGHNLIECDPNEPEGYGELYDIEKDPWNMNNLARSAPKEALSWYKERLANLKKCAGKDCNNQ